MTSHALTDGDWMTDRCVQRWQPVVVIELPPARPAHEIVACHCGARADEPCRTRNGHKTGKEHAGRTVARCCPCGGPVEGRRQWCHACRVANDRRCRRNWKRMQKAAARRIVGRVA